ncbi:protein IQ-DOMAIN 9-like [Tasmannia lanceolata]|uniref:protein IQ-DOMAIN 9-like n=1 Tax=Tasmannia lanceolata TaxID=3420 RepID=UPI004063B7DB
MGSGDWFKTIISLKKAKEDRSKQSKEPSTTGRSNGFKWRYRSHKGSNKFRNGASSQNHRVLGMPIEDIAATQIQTAFRGFLARKALRRLKGAVRLQVLTQRHSVNKQASTTLTYLKSWNKIQAQVRARRLCMVTEGHIRQKKHDNQLKLEAKLHDLEVEWSGGPDTMEEILARIQQREVAAVKRERAMAYAFSHQWRANPWQNQGQIAYDFGKGDWGWSWMERWIAARPWESRIPSQPIVPKKVQSRQTSNAGKDTNPSATKISISIKPSSNGKGPTRLSELEKVKRLSTEKPVTQEAKNKSASESPPKAVEANITREQSV